jgi:hypothetical protein
MSEKPDRTERFLEEYRQLVLRWNSQINLISRQDTATRLDALINQCRSAWSLLVTHPSSGWPQAAGLWYFDLGSGNGLPGVVWHSRMAAAHWPVKTLLVEPRGKRAWFLERVARLAGPEPVAVATGRWGEIPADVPALDPGPSHVLISLKALRLPDSAVLAGLVPFLKPGPGGDISLKIARFHPPAQSWTPELAQQLDIPPAGGRRQVGSRLFVARGGEILAPATLREASLVVSTYLISAS